MKVFTYGIENSNMEIIKKRFGDAEYYDVTSQYQDILALRVDVVVMAVEHTPSDVLDIIKAYQAEVSEEEDTVYYYLSDAEIIG